MFNKFFITFYLNTSIMLEKGSPTTQSDEDVDPTNDPLIALTQSKKHLIINS